MKYSFILIVVFIFLCGTGSAQTFCKGMVVEAGTLKPIVAASVFISNSSVGTVTDEGGNFILTKLPASNFTLVVSCIGYGTYVGEIDPRHLSLSLLVELRRKTAELGEAVVAAHDKNGWIKWGDVFIEHFIGKSAWAGACRIKNPKVLKFSNSADGTILKVWANEPLLIENRALGYLISYDLHTFSFNFSTNTVAYSGYPLFTEIPGSNSKTAATNNENRRKVYAVSLLHFIRSLYNGNTEEQHFRVIRVFNGIKGELKKNLIPAPEYSGFEDYDTVYEISNKETLVKIVPAAADSARQMKRPPYNPYSFDDILSWKSGVGNLYFADTLQVLYTGAKVPVEYLKDAEKNYGGTMASAIFLLQARPVSIFANGSYTEASGLGLSGFWAWWEKMANMLPYDYQPDEMPAGNIKRPAGN